MNLSMDSIGQVQQNQRMVKKALNGTALPPLLIPTREEGGILAAPTKETTLQAAVQQEVPPGSNPQVRFPPLTPVIAEVFDMNKGTTEMGRGTWMPKMDFPRFDGTDVRIWIDKCNTFFTIYKIPEGFKVAAATMYMSDSAAHWYQAYKMTNLWHGWEQFRDAVATEF